MLQDTEDKSRVLGGKDQEESKEGRRGTSEAEGDGVALYNRVGV